VLEYLGSVVTPILAAGAKLDIAVSAAISARGLRAGAELV
jgi:hypothetical protein